MRPLSPRLQRLIAAAGSSVLGLLIAWIYLQSRDPAPTVEVVDQSEEMGELLELRAAEPASSSRDGKEGAESSPPSWPRPLVRESLDRETASLFFPMLRTNGVYDPFVFVLRPPNWDKIKVWPEWHEGSWRVRTNSSSLRENEDILAEKPDVRILVTGDSHTDGTCPNELSFANVLESLLARKRPGEVVEVLNAGMGAFQFYNYLGVLERFRDLDSDVFVVAAYGGNDFFKNLNMLRYFERLPPPSRARYRPGRLKRLNDVATGFVPQELAQIAYFVNNPDDVPLAVENACSISAEITRQCAELGTKPLFVYLPPPSRGQPRLFAETMNGLLDSLGIEREMAEVSDRVADGWLDFLEDQEIPHLDLRPIFRESPDPYYWQADLHLNISGHRRVALELMPLVTRTLERAPSEDR